ncbi:tyrosine-protein phosphatase [Nocardia amamiensis]|uniref:Tyrosine-protein phosphatase n=1 Tax=Nocardia amamiensis TaxID=404578 RepID=A0ABS0D2E8_9NOCA|nr:tyrosine-protein phosphatase [Nocardia amamiensis]MBF6302177.1 tyrosine-protein phosphatase [Nocardia amamiensis]
MTISRAVRGAVAGVAAALIAVFPSTTTAFAGPGLVHTVHNRSMELSAAPNARDIGDYPTQGNGKLRTGVVFRTEAMDKITAADQQKLVTLGITKVIDFRSPTESQANPDKLPASIPVQARPVYDPANDFYVMVGKAVQGGPAVQQQMFGDGKAAEIMRAYYRWFVTDATARAQFGAAIRDVANATGPVLYHCTAGKDRTGWMTAILMTALGVPKGQVYKDYLESNDNLAAGNKALMDGLVARGLVTDPALFDPILGVRSDFLDAAFDQAGASFGSFDRFVSDGLGVDGATLDALKSKLLPR